MSTFFKCHTVEKISFLTLLGLLETSKLCHKFQMFTIMITGYAYWIFELLKNNSGADIFYWVMCWPLHCCIIVFIRVWIPGPQLCKQCDLSQNWHLVKIRCHTFVVTSSWAQLSSDDNNLLPRPCLDSKHLPKNVKVLNMLIKTPPCFSYFKGCHTYCTRSNFGINWFPDFRSFLVNRSERSEWSDWNRHFSSFFVILVIFGHFWSFLVIFGHFWSFFVNFCQFSSIFVNFRQFSLIFVNFP